MRIVFETIPHSKQRYNTCGDWWYAPNGDWEIRVSNMSDWRYEFLVFFHEILEMAWCKFTGVTQQEVDAFDMSYKGDAEPGDERKAPYFGGHQSATICERVAAVVLGVDWKLYEQEINNLS